MLFLPIAILAGSAAASSFIAYEGDCKKPGDQVGNIDFNVLSSNWKSGCKIISTSTGRSFALWNIPVSAIFSTCVAQVYHDTRCGSGEQTLFVSNLAACNNYNGIHSMKIVCT
ncbi:hypothetical protein Tdes44962_MAKER09526 [Teratosphaeria destructans]|uniref:Uncharacterized protein n=1 Tax=Teratosphaeria destructans TaxID=418781 RepID=A0A9W7ST20_9PEZI|nr:hypothetical protein Tdes44962_MAKER09526 [Teratosphaeria destructans]